MRELPSGWSWQTLGDVAEYIQRGKSPQYTPTSSLPVVNQKCVRWDGVDTRYLKFVDPSQWPAWSGERTLRDGDILWNSTGTGTIGRAAIFRPFPGFERVVSDSHVTVIRTRSALPEYVHAWIRSPEVQSRIDDMQSGSTNQVELGRAEIVKTRIPIAPLSEQSRIVAKLDALQTRSRRAREALDSIPPLLEKLRQSILAAAFRGDLTKDWRAKHPDVEPASELLKRIRVERRRKWEEAELAKMVAKGKPPKDDRWKEKYEEPKGVDWTGLPPLPRGWCWATLDELTHSSLYGPRFSAADYVAAATPTIRTTDMDETGRIRWKEPPTVRVTQEQLDELGCIDGDLLVTRTGSIGKCAVYEGDVGPALPSAYLIRFRLVERPTLGRFVFRQLQSPRLQVALGIGTTATTQPNINARTLGGLAVAVCSSSERAEVVRILEDRLSVLDQRSSALRDASAELEELNRSTLAKAFRGELVPQDPSDAPVTLPTAPADPTPRANARRRKRGA